MSESTQSTDGRESGWTAGRHGRVVRWWLTTIALGISLTLVVLGVGVVVAQSFQRICIDATAGSCFGHTAGELLSTSPVSTPP